MDRNPGVTAAAEPDEDENPVRAEEATAKPGGDAQEAGGQPPGGPADGPAGNPLKRALRRRIGWIPPYELRTKIMLGHTAIGLRRFENAEVRRLRRSRPASPPTLVTTVIPTFRRPERLLEAIESALAQTVGGRPADQLVLVVDDGAGLPALPADPRVAAVSLSRNIAVAGVVRNVGVRLARSTFVAFLDDDNLWEPDHLETALAALTGSGGPGDGSAGTRPEGVYTALLRVRPDGTEAGILSEPFDRRTARERSFLDTNTFEIGRAHV